MKKILVFIAALALSLTLVGCTPETVIEYVDVPMELSELPATMDDINDVDDYLGRPDVQYVDLRNFDDKMKSGYIAGFEMIPFFDYLEAADVLVRTDGDWTFAAADIVNQGGLFELFDQDKTIFLMCGSGTRAGFVMDALLSLGYEDVINVGGISSYTGDNKVLGDGTFELNHPMSGSFTPGTYFAVDPTTQYTATIVVGAGGYIEDVVFDAMYHGTTKNTLGAGYTLGSGVTWQAEAAELAAYVQANQGWGEIILDVTDITGMNMLTAPHHFIEINHDGAVDAVSGVTIGAEGFVLAWNLAIEMAGGTAIADIPTSDEWAAAHAPAYVYNDGVFFGDTDAGYTARVTIEDGVITDVYFDALNVRTSTEIVYDVEIPAVLCDADDVTAGTLDAAGAACVLDAVKVASYLEDQVTVTYTTFSTKQALQEGYTLASGITWAAEADELAAAIVDMQQWDPLWVIIPGVDGGHDDFDMTDTYTVDAVGGVTIGMEGFYESFEEAITKAIPTT